MPTATGDTVAAPAGAAAGTSADTQAAEDDAGGRDGGGAPSVDSDPPPALPQDVIPNGRVTVPTTDRTVVESSNYSDREAGTRQLMLLPGVTHEDGVTGLTENPDDTPEERAACRDICAPGGRAEPVLECQEN